VRRKLLGMQEGHLRLLVGSESTTKNTRKVHRPFLVADGHTHLEGDPEDGGGRNSEGVK
jgi:hypothetical protein